MTGLEAEAVMEMLDTCENPPMVDVRVALENATGEHKPEPDGGDGEFGLRVVRRGGGRGGVQVPGEPGRRGRIPEGDGAERAGWGR